MEMSVHYALTKLIQLLCKYRQAFCLLYLKLLHVSLQTFLSDACLTIYKALRCLQGIMLNLKM